MHLLGSKICGINLAFCLSICWAGGQDVDITSEVQPIGVRIKVATVLTVPYDSIWSTLTDYDQLSSFVPGIKSSTLVNRDGTSAFVRQIGEARLLFFKVPLNVLVRTTEKKPYSISVELVEGNLRHLSGRYTLRRLSPDNSWELSWEGIIDPELRLPDFVTKALIQRDIKAQFEAMIFEIKRRAKDYVPVESMKNDND